MKRLITIAYAVFSAAVMSAAQIDGIIVRQQWPWSTDVKVDYMLSGVTSPVDVNVQFFDGTTAMTPAGSLLSLKGDLRGVATNGEKSFRFNPKELFGADMPSVSAFKVSLTLSNSAANIRETLYKIYDLENGGCTDVTRADLLNGKYGTIETNYTAFTGFDTPVSDVLIWTGVTNDVKYATTHLVMRKISAKNQTFKMGSPSGETGRGDSETQHDVTFTNDFYIGVFEVTQYQYWKITDSWPSLFSLEECRDARPVEEIPYQNVRGGDNGGVAQFQRVGARGIGHRAVHTVNDRQVAAVQARHHHTVDPQVVERSHWLTCLRSHELADRQAEAGCQRSYSHEQIDSLNALNHRLERQTARLGSDRTCPMRGVSMTCSAMLKSGAWTGMHRSRPTAKQSRQALPTTIQTINASFVVAISTLGHPIHGPHSAKATLRTIMVTRDQEVFAFA